MDTTCLQEGAGTMANKQTVAPTAMEELAAMTAMGERVGAEGLVSGPSQGGSSGNVPGATNGLEQRPLDQETGGDSKRRKV